MITPEGMQVLANGALIALLCSVLHYATKKPSTKRQSAIEASLLREEGDC